jgi:hypothetical protein
MVLIESNSAMCDMQDRIFVLSVMFSLVMMQLSRADNGAAESVLTAEA